MSQFLSELHLLQPGPAARLVQAVFDDANSKDRLNVPPANLNVNEPDHVQFEWWEHDKMPGKINLLAMNVTSTAVVFERTEGDATAWHKMPATTSDERKQVVAHLLKALVELL